MIQSLDCVVSPIEEMELYWYFSVDPPPVPGEGSVFGAMCERLERLRFEREDENKSKHRRRHQFCEAPEQAEAEVPWTQFVHVGHQYPSAGGEDAMIAYVDAQRRARRVLAALKQLSARDYLVLQVRFGTDEQDVRAYDRRLVDRFGSLVGVVLLTPTYEREQRRLLRRGRKETGYAVVGQLITLQRNAVAPKARRESARDVLDSMRREAIQLVTTAVQAYAAARKEARAK
jgi:hypothetical protein